MHPTPRSPRVHSIHAEESDCSSVPVSKPLQVAVIGSGAAAFAAAIRLWDEGQM